MPAISAIPNLWSDAKRDSDLVASLRIHAQTSRLHRATEDG